jgi:acyl dehydratase
LAIDYEELVPGQRVSRRSYVLDGEMIADYMAAVQDESGMLDSRDSERLVPPMSIAALTVGGVVQDLQIPGGSLHVRQELDFVRAVPVGETLLCEATLMQNSVRGGWRFMVLESDVQDSQGRKVMAGKSTVILPVPGEDSSGAEG